MSRPLPMISTRAVATLIVTVAVPLLLGAADQLHEALERLRGMSPQRQAQLADTLKRFDLAIPTNEQKAIRELDGRINRLPAEDRGRYLAVLRRYQNWLETLPETVRDGLLSKAPDQRLQEITGLVARYPVPVEKTPAWIRFTDLSGPSDFELAAVFKLWNELTPEEQREIENQPTVLKRREDLLTRGFQRRALREVRPSDFRLDEWIPKAEARIEELRPYDPELNAAIAKAERKIEELAKDRPAGKLRLRSPVVRRLAANLYLESQEAPHAVPGDRLAAFLGAMPPWARTQFESYPADEARRRLTTIYRLVYPHPEEFEPSGKNVAAPGKATGRGAAPSAKKAAPPAEPKAPRPASPGPPSRTAVSPF